MNKENKNYKKMFVNISGWGAIKWGNNVDAGTVAEKVASGVNYFIMLSALVAVAMIIVSGYTLITSGGEPEKVEKGQKGLTAAVVGMVIVFLIKIIVTAVINLVEKGDIG